jgi:plastocyanin
MTAFLGLAAAGCTGAATPAPTTATPTGTPSTGTSSPAATAATSAAAANTLNVTAREYAFEMPTSVGAGVTTVSLKNTGAEEHQAQIAKLNEGITFDQLAKALQAPDPTAAFQLLNFSGGPAGVAPGATGTATMSLAPGQYVFLCFVSAPDGLPHLAKGMVSQLQVTGSASTAQVPSGEIAMAAKDFSFDVPSTPLKAGKHSFTLTNNGPQPHEAQLVKLAAGTTVDQLKAMLSATPAPGTTPSTSGPPPWSPSGGVAAISANAKATFDVDVTAGNYAFLCFVPDPNSGRAHFELGMITGVTVQ